MFRNHNDTDVMTWIPPGGSSRWSTLWRQSSKGPPPLDSDPKSTWFWRASTKANSKLSSHQKEIFKVDDHIGVAIAELIADGRVLSRYMRSDASTTQRFVVEDRKLSCVSLQNLMQLHCPSRWNYNPHIEQTM
ncbi:hypothetical protein C1H46_008478 [Malus baccata]|uniref:Proteasome alpha-type subunits domain-containing protein n=1 Tax=Malus baccata TaxID=106549 RepID=A0A540N4J5_MALBA|nr:hypothetical protein C1H46_008478 [Malus baccata]